MESATCCGMELIAKQSYGIKLQKNTPLVIPYQACGLNKKRQIPVAICLFLVRSMGPLDILYIIITLRGYKRYSIYI